MRDLICLLLPHIFNHFASRWCFLLLLLLQLIFHHHPRAVVFSIGKIQWNYLCLLINYSGIQGYKDADTDFASDTTHLWHRLVSS